VTVPRMDTQLAAVTQAQLAAERGLAALKGAVEEQAQVSEHVCVHRPRRHASTQPGVLAGLATLLHMFPTTSLSTTCILPITTLTLSHLQALDRQRTSMKAQVAALEAQKTDALCTLRELEGEVASWRARVEKEVEVQGAVDPTYGTQEASELRWVAALQEGCRRLI
jgi:hypothetical protein